MEVEDGAEIIIGELKEDLIFLGTATVKAEDSQKIIIHGKIEASDDILFECSIQADELESSEGDIEVQGALHVSGDIEIEDGWLALDIGPKTVEAFKKELQSAKTVVWNGPVGVFEFEKFRSGSKAIADAIANSSSMSIIGGGDTAAAMKVFGLEDKMSHISTGGGASLEYLEGKVLPGVAALNSK